MNSSATEDFFGTLPMSTTPRVNTMRRQYLVAKSKENMAKLPTREKCVEAK